MPRGDQTGPMGIGAMTGRAAGYCAGSGVPGYAHPAPGRGFGTGFGSGRAAGGRGAGGFGRRCRNVFHATGHPGWMRFGGYAGPYGYPTTYPKPDPEMEKRALKNQAEALQSQLESIQKRLAEIETAGPADYPPSA
jgi:hypothetical protein